MAFATPQLPNSLGLPSGQYVDSYVRGWKEDVSMQIGGSPDLLPMQNNLNPVIVWDEQPGHSGMTPAVSLDVTPPEMPTQGYIRRSELPFYFQEQQALSESDFLHIAAAGSLNRLAGRELVLDGQDRLRARLDARIEWTRWKALQGSLAINVNNIKRTVTYAVDSISAPGTLWSNTASADPIANVMAWVLRFRGKKGNGNIKLYYNAQTAIYLANNANVRDLVKANNMATQLGTNNVGNILSLLIGGVDFIQYDGGYQIDNGDGTFTYDPYIPDGVVIMVAPAPNGQSIGAWKSTQSIRNGGPFNPTPGRFGWVQDDTRDKQLPIYRHGQGIYGIPILWFPGNVGVVDVN